MARNIFIILAWLGVIFISVLSFAIPNHPYETVPALTIFSFDKPLWLCFLIGDSFVYLVVLYSIYDEIKKKNRSTFFRL